MSEQKIIFGLAIALLALFALVATNKANKSASKFSLSDAFLDDLGKTSHARIAYFVALVCSTWAFVYITIDGKLTEWFYLTYMGAWVFGSLGNKWLDKK